jgi:hypothetical protein
VYLSTETLGILKRVCLCEGEATVVVCIGFTCEPMYKPATQKLFFKDLVAVMTLFLDFILSDVDTSTLYN